MGNLCEMNRRLHFCFKGNEKKSTEMSCGHIKQMKEIHTYSAEFKDPQYILFTHTSFYFLLRLVNRNLPSH